eukprot:Gb_26178 [translate_table: standard]
MKAPLRLSVPPRPPLPSSSSSTLRVYPNPYTPSSTKLLPFSPSPTPTPSKRPRAKPWLPWLCTFLHLSSLYSLNSWLQSSPPTLPLAPFTFLVLLISAIATAFQHRQTQRNRPLTSPQLAALLANGSLLALVFLLRSHGLRSCGPMETILAEFAGGLAGKALVEFSLGKTSDRGRKVRGLIALITGLFLISQGWDRAACFPLGAFKLMKIFDKPAFCIRVVPMMAPLAAGFMGSLEKSSANRSSMKHIGKKRVRVISLAIASAMVFPFAIFKLALMGADFYPEFLGISMVWPLISTVSFGGVLSFYHESYCEEKLLMPTLSPKLFFITMCSTFVLELVFGLELSLLGFLFCAFILWISVRDLGSPSGWMAYSILESDSSDAFSSLVKNPLHHVLSERKSRKIAMFLLINTGFMAVEFIYGFMSNSLGLISDACHMLFDCAALAIGLYASYISRLPANGKFNYGYGRFEVLSGYVNAVFLVLVGSLIVLESFERILDPQEISTESLLLVSVGGLLVNIVGLIFFHEEHHHGHAHSGGGGCSHSHSHENHHHLSHFDSHDSGSHNHSHTCTIKSAPCSPGSHGFRKSEENGLNARDHSHPNHEDGHIDPGQCQHGTPHDHSCSDHNCVEDHTERSHDHNCDGHKHSHKGGLIAHEQCEVVLPSHEHGKHSPSCAHDHLIPGKHGHQGDKRDCFGERKQVEIVSLHHHGGDAHEHHRHFEQNHIHSHSHLEHGHFHSEDSHSHSHLEHSHSHLGHGNSADEPHGDISQHKSKDHHHIDHNMEGIFLHVLADTLGSVGVVISTLLIKYKGWLIADPACSIFISILIISSVIPLLRNAAEMLLQRVPRFNANDMKQALEGIQKLQGVHDCQNMHVWSFTNKEVVGTLHLHVSADSDKTLIRGQVAHLLHDAGIKDLMLQMEYVGDS